MLFSSGRMPSANGTALEHGNGSCMNILLQNRGTLHYVQSNARWTTQAMQARVFDTGLEAIFFCFNHQILNMQILARFSDERMNFTVPVTDLRS